MKKIQVTECSKSRNSGRQVKRCLPHLWPAERRFHVWATPHRTSLISSDLGSSARSGLVSIRMGACMGTSDAAGFCSLTWPAPSPFGQPSSPAPKTFGKGEACLGFLPEPRFSGQGRAGHRCLQSWCSLHAHCLMLENYVVQRIANYVLYPTEQSPAFFLLCSFLSWNR